MLVTCRTFVIVISSSTRSMQELMS
jgi:hypothetical protein